MLPMWSLKKNEKTIFSIVLAILALSFSYHLPLFSSFSLNEPLQLHQHWIFQNVNMTEMKEGQFEDQAMPLVCLHISDKVAASLLTCSTGFSGSLCLPHHTRLSVDHTAGRHQNTAEPMPGLLHCSSFYVEVHLSSVLHRKTWLILTEQDIIPQESAVQNCDSSYSSQLWQNLFIFF